LHSQTLEPAAADKPLSPMAGKQIHSLSTPPPPSPPAFQGDKTMGGEDSEESQPPFAWGSAGRSQLNFQIRENHMVSLLNSH